MIFMDSDTLRLILIVAGGLFLVGLYVWERRRSRPDQNEPLEDGDLEQAKREPQLGPWQGDADGGATADAMPSQSGRLREPEQPELHLEPPDTAPEDVEPEAPKSPMILLFHLTPVKDTFDGETIVHAASECGIEPGEMEVFHRYRDPGTPSGALFSIANMVKPGTFPFGAMAEFQSPGLTMFSQAEGAADDPGRLEEMLTTAHCLANLLDAQILDETRSPLTPEVEQRLRDRVLELVAWRLSDPGQE